MLHAYVALLLLSCGVAQIDKVDIACSLPEINTALFRHQSKKMPRRNAFARLDDPRRSPCECAVDIAFVWLIGC
jgi:hypothetical protein